MIHALADYGLMTDQFGQRVFVQPAQSCPKASLQEAVLEAIATVQSDEARLSQSKAQLKEQLETVMCALLPVGSTIRRAQRSGPGWLWRVQTMRGNDRGTNTFVIASKPSVEPNTAHPDLSRWSCEAIPVSEKTGNPMSGKSHGPDGKKETVRLVGGFGLSDIEENSILMSMVAAAGDAMAKQAASESAVPASKDD